ncbi:putative dihydroflavonol 4-reductase [Quercus suber]|uniref:Dihydroflavonol 4-reductase n=1 Tax=Quercus suber TaxID=58331 RepID=A0AAW0ITC2_QUESU
MKKILVTGATGYLGGRLCHALLQQGHPVRVLVRRTSDLSSLPPPTDAAAPSKSSTVMSPTTGLSSLPAPTATSSSTWLPSSSPGFPILLSSSPDIEKLIYTSSFFALGPTDDGCVADENQVHHEKYFCTEYEKSKAYADKIAIQAASEGVPIVAVYPGVIYGPGKVTAGNVVARMIYGNYLLIWVFVKVWKRQISFSHVDDVVEGHIAAMNKGQPGERYLLTGENASFRHVFDIAAIITETKKPLFSIPFWAIDAYGWASVMFSRITESFL